LFEGKAMHITMASTHKPKAHEPTPRAGSGGRQAATGSNGAEAPAAEPAEEPAEAPAVAGEEKSGPPAAQPASTAATPAAATGE
jgi:hypothetical protein